MTAISRDLTALVPPGFETTPWELVCEVGRTPYYEMWILKADAFPDTGTGDTVARINVTLDMHDALRAEPRLDELIRNKIEFAVLWLRDLYNRRGVPFPS